MLSNNKVVYFVVSVVVAFSSVFSVANAQDDAGTLEEIIVTAQKREQSVQDVGLTVAAFTDEQYRELTRGTLDGLAAQVSNLQAYANNTFLESVHIRGIGLNEFQGQFDSPVATHFDEVYIAKPWMKARRNYDIGRVEVLKGPQGTLFGRNTTGGSVNYYTKAPVDEFEAELEAAIDEHERYRVTGMINSPLSDQLSGRFSFNTELGNGGPQKNLFSGDEHGRPDILDFRGQLLWSGEKLTVRALVHGGTNKSDSTAWKGPGIFNLGAPGLCPQLFTGEVSKSPSSCPKTAGFAILNGFPQGEFEPEGIHTINQNKPPTGDDTFYGGYLRWDYEIGNATLTSITAYEYYERIHTDDSQADMFNSTSTHYYNEMNQVSQELRLAGFLSERWRYILGFFYENDDLDQVDGSDLSQQQVPGIT
ncbi:MAG: TonB-dependent receptor plug domain-containing protein, partial [Gammaproteobacteria bacterium]|nr:TonB-dependent receptor plug domain-containing protein [Gammaproteobacteria bacterium]